MKEIFSMKNEKKKSIYTQISQEDYQYLLRWVNYNKEENLENPKSVSSAMSDAMDMYMEVKKIKVWGIKNERE